MKILWVSPWFGNYRVPVYEELNKLSGGSFYIICSKENTRDLVRYKLKASLGDQAIILEGEKRSTFGSEESDFANSALVIKKQPGLYDAICKVNPDVLIVEGFGSWSPAGIKYSVLHKKRLCMFYERTFHVERNCPWYRTMYRRIVGIPVNHFLVNGQLTEEYLLDGLGFKNKPITKGCMCADSYGLSKSVEEWTKAKEDCEKHRNEGGLNFLFVGQMVERKGIKQLLSAWAKHHDKWPNDRLIAIGQGVLLDGLRETYDGKFGVSLPGSVNYDHIHEYYADCDVFIMPTLEDNWCLVIPEAMACGKPIAGSIYNGGTPELVKNGVSGWQFDPLKENSILDVLNKFHGADITAMGEEAKKIEKNYTPDKVGKRIYDACCGVK